MRVSPIPLSLDEPYEFEQPLEIDDARQALHKIAEQRRDAREWFQRALKAKGDAENTYRKERALAWVRVKARLKDATAKEREDAVNADTADLRHKRDDAESLVKATQERLEEVDAERASLHRLVDWSMKVDSRVWEMAAQGSGRAVN